MRNPVDGGKQLFPQNCGNQRADGAGGDIAEDCGITVRKWQYLKGRVREHGLN